MTIIPANAAYGMENQPLINHNNKLNQLKKNNHNDEKIDRSRCDGIRNI